MFNTIFKNKTNKTKKAKADNSVKAATSDRARMVSIPKKAATSIGSLENEDMKTKGVKTNKKKKAGRSLFGRKKARTYRAKAKKSVAVAKPQEPVVTSAYGLDTNMDMFREMTKELLSSRALKL